jgi:hypothetical protein
MRLYSKEAKSYKLLGTNLMVTILKIKASFYKLYSNSIFLYQNYIGLSGTELGSLKQGIVFQPCG